MTKPLDYLPKCKIGRYEITILPEHQLANYRNQWKRFDKAPGEIANLLWELYPGFTAVDIGANVGDSVAVICNKYNIDVLCIEGSEKFLPLLKENISKINSDIEIYEGFIGIENQFADNDFEYNYEGSLSIAKKMNESEGTISENQNSLSNVLKSYPKFAEPKFIKIDTDGMDFYIIRNSLDVFKKSHPVIFFEYALEFRDDAKTESIAAINDLLDCGYKAFIVYDNFGNLLTTIDKDYEKRFKELNSYLLSNIKNGTAVFYFDVCAVAEKDLVIVDKIVKAAESDVGNDDNIIKDNSDETTNVNLSNLLNEVEKLIAVKQYDKALQSLNNFLQDEPDNIDVLNNLAVVQILKGMWEEASETLKKVLDIDPDNQMALNNVRYLEKQLIFYKAVLEAEALINKNDLNGAERILNEILKSEPDHIDALNDLAVVNIYQNEYDNALDIINKVLEIDSENEIANDNLHQLKIMMKGKSVL